MARNRMTIDRQSTKTHVVEQSALFVELLLTHLFAIHYYTFQIIAYC